VGRRRHTVDAEVVDDDVVSGPTVDRVVARPADEDIVVRTAD
jgi:hypothetical protein